MKSFLFSSVLGIGLGWILGSQILNGERLNFTPVGGPSVTTLARPMKFASANRQPVKIIVAKKPVTQAKVARRHRRRVALPVESGAGLRESASIASLVSRGLGQ
jgi:hypothetical protein